MLIELLFCRCAVCHCHSKQSPSNLLFASAVLCHPFLCCLVPPGPVGSARGAPWKAPGAQEEPDLSLMASDLKAASLCSQAAPILLPAPFLSFSFAPAFLQHSLPSLPFTTPRSLLHRLQPRAKHWHECPGRGSSDMASSFPGTLRWASLSPATSHARAMAAGGCLKLGPGWGHLLLPPSPRRGLRASRLSPHWTDTRRRTHSGDTGPCRCP